MSNWRRDAEYHDAGEWYGGLTEGQRLESDEAEQRGAMEVLLSNWRRDAGEWYGGLTEVQRLERDEAEKRRALEVIQFLRAHEGNGRKREREERKLRKKEL